MAGSAQQLPVHIVSTLCRRETTRYLQRLANDPAYCYELFRRGLGQPPHGDRELAWQAIYTQYHLQLVRAAQKHPLIGNLADSAETIADQAFSKMWQTFHNNPNKFDRFDHLGGVIKFLQACVHSIIVDKCRRQQTQENATIDPATNGEMSELERTELWTAIRQRIRDPQEATVLYGCFELGLPARKVYEAFADQFDNVREIHRITERIVRRLRRDEALKQFLAVYHE